MLEQIKLMKPNSNILSKIIGIIFPIWLTFFLVLVSTFFVLVPSLKQNMLAQKKETIKQLVDSHLNLLETINNKSLAGEITLSQAQDIAISQFRSLRYGPDKKDYFWINDMHPFMVMHPYRSDLVGKDLTSFKDSQGSYPFIAMVSKVMQSGSGYVNYYWQWKNDQSQTAPKISYVKGFKPWGWILGTGIYTEDVNREINSILRNLFKTSIFILLIILIISFYLTIQTVRIEKERISSVQELRESEKMHRFFIDNAPIGMYTINLKGEFTYINKKLESITGYSRENWLYKSFIPLIHPEDLCIVEEKIRLRCDGLGTSDPYEIRIYNSEGGVIWIRIISESIFDTSSQSHPLIGMQSFVEDITQQKNVLASLELSEGRLKTILEANPDPMVVYDLNGHPEYLNPAFTMVFGWTLDELKYEIIPFVPKNEQKITAEKIKEIYQYGYSLTFETKRYTKDEICLDILISAAVHKNEKGNAIGMVVNLKDVTEQNKTREMMIQSEKMLTVGGLAAGMAHEINNPLAGMIQNANVIKSRLGNVDIPANIDTANELGISIKNIRNYMEKREIFHMIDAINKSGYRAAEIVDSMLNFARKSESIFSSYYPNQIMDKSIELAATDYDLKKQYDFKSIKIKKEYERNLPLIICEGTKIQQVLLNILRNGAQAMQEDKKRKPKFIIRIYSEGEPKFICLEIEDNGPGMDEVTQSKIFEPFFTTKPVGEGTGLGLSVSYFIITETHKGTMDVISEPTKGSNFIIRLPVQPELNV